MCCYINYSILSKRNILNALFCQAAGNAAADNGDDDGEEFAEWGQNEVRGGF